MPPPFPARLAGTRRMYTRVIVSLAHTTHAPQTEKLRGVCRVR